MSALLHAGKNRERAGVTRSQGTECAHPDPYRSIGQQRAIIGRETLDEWIARPIITLSARTETAKIKGGS